MTKSNEMLKFAIETNKANNVLGLRRYYNLPLNDDNIKKMSVSHWKSFVRVAIFKEALFQLQVELSSNRKTNQISYQHSFLKTNDYLIKLPSHLARLVFKAKTRMLGIKINYKRNIQMVYIVHFVLSMMRHLDIYSNALQDSEYLNS